MKRIIILIFAIILLASVRPVLAVSPSIYFYTQQKSFAPGSEFILSVFLKSTLFVNAVNVEIGYTPDTLQFEGSNDANSIVTIWQKRPIIARPGVIQFTGATLKPYEGDGGILAELRFRTRGEGEAGVSLITGNIYAADGKGTLLRAPNFFARFAVVSDAPKTEVVPPADSTPPVLTAQLAPNPYDGSVLLVYETEDKESGIRQARFREKSWFTWSAWQPAENPVSLPPAAWSLELQAENNAGLITLKAFTRPEIWWKRIGLLFFILLTLIFARILYNKRDRRKPSFPASPES